MVAKIIAVDGNIGVGKTTFARAFARTHKCHLIEERVGDNPYLDKFYADPGKYAFDLEVWLLKERARAMLEAMTYKGTVIIERTYHSCISFSRVLYQRGFITLAQWTIIKGLRDSLDEILPAPDALLVLDASPEICHERVIARERKCEKAVTFGYLEDLHRLIWVQADHMLKLSSEVIRLNWTNFKGRNIEERLRKIRTRFLGSVAICRSRRGVPVEEIRKDVSQILGFQ